MRAQNRPKPCSTVPFQRDSAFVGREGILATICKKLEQAALRDHGRVALIGLGGVGYAFPYIVRCEVMLMFELGSPRSLSIMRTESESRLRKPGCFGCMRATPTDLSKLIETSLPRSNSPAAMTQSLISSNYVYDWLGDERNGRWLMVIDNADDDEVFFAADEDSVGIAQKSAIPSRTRPLESFIP